MSWARAALRAQHYSDAAFGAYKGVLDGLILGALDERQLEELDVLFYESQENYRNEAYNLGGLQSWERAAVDRHFPAGCTVVVTGAGGGREVLALLELGYDAIGFESHPALVEYGMNLAEERGHHDRMFPCPRSKWPMDAPPAQAAIIGWGSYTLIHTRANRVDFLRSAREALDPGAPILLSFFVRSAPTRRLRITKLVGDVLRKARRRIPLELGDALSPNLVHIFAPEEINAEFNEAGLSTVQMGTREYGWAILGEQRI